MVKQRRRFLQALGAGAAGLLAGCTGGDGSDGTTDTPEATTDSSGGTTTTAPQTTTDGNQNGGGGGSQQLIIQEAGGADIWNGIDRGHFFYKWHDGDFDVKVRVLSVEDTDPNAKGGIMARASMEPDAAHVYVRRRPPGYIVVQWRPSKGAQARSLTSDAGADENEFDGQIPADWQWMRLVREGNTFRAMIGPDGEEWNLLAELTESEVSMPQQSFLGLAATSHNQSEVTTVRYMGLEGVEPSNRNDLDGPIKSGSVTVTNPAISSTAGTSSTGTNSATVEANLESMGGASEVDVTFQYRELMSNEWQEAATETASETGTVSADISGLTARRYYQYRVISNNGETDFTSSAATFATDGTESGDSEGPESAAHHDMADGFADAASWLDDSTPIIKIREASAELLKRAVAVNGPRIIVFETSGVIDLDGGLSVEFPECFIAGQTAPSPGITLTRGQVTIAANDVVVQHIRSRPGDDGRSAASGWEPGALDTADGTQNIVVDHCSLSWATDENVSIGYRSENTTLSNCLIAEPLNDSTHSEGPHGYSVILGDNSKNVSVMGNTLAFTTDRNPRLKEGNESVVVNNYVHHFSDGVWLSDDDGQPLNRASIEGNVYEEAQTTQPNIFGLGEAHIADNVNNTDNPMVGEELTQVDSRPLWPDGMTAMAGSETKSHNLENAGARPADRSRVDQRIVENLRNGDGGVIDSQEDVGGYPALFENTTTHDIPESGVRAWLREQALAVES